MIETALCGGKASKGGVTMPYCMYLRKDVYKRQELNCRRGGRGAQRHVLYQIVPAAECDNYEKNRN